ncbi:MAG: hypothetical protein J6X53_06125 [Abditibacteriota bacterium]|nr:hypothetical protein [Abditibacteriota bacterium]
MKDFSMIQAELAQPFAPQDLEWRVQHANREKTRGLAVPYVTSRAIQDRLDAVVGAQNWRNEFQPWQGGKKGAQICGISIYVEERTEWITKWDGAENTNIEAVKGGLSDSMKRAAVQWGIGRVLYKLPSIWVNVEPRGDSCYIPDTERPNLDGFYLDAIKMMNLVPAAPGGLQSQLAGMSDPGVKQQDMTRTGGNAGQNISAAGRNGIPAGQNRAPARQGSRPAVQSTAQQGNRPVSTYTVMTYKVLGGNNRQTTNFQLRDNSTGELIQVFLNGVDQRLVPNVVLGSVKITPMNQGGVNYLALEKYEVLTPMNKAA